MGDVTVCATATQQMWHIPTDQIMDPKTFSKAIIM